MLENNTLILNHIKSLKDHYNRLNPTNDKKEIGYLSNLRNLIKELEDSVSFQEIVFKNIENPEFFQEKLQN